MNREELENLKEKYLEGIKERDKLKKAKERLNVLKRNPAVREYLGLINVKDLKILSNDEILENIIQETLVSNDNLSNIYVFMGAYSNNNGLNTVEYASEEVDYFLYCNIENDHEYKKILPSNKEEFESTRMIINFKDSGFDWQKFYKIQQYYFNELINGNDEEEILERIKTKYKNLI